MTWRTPKDKWPSDDLIKQALAANSTGKPTDQSPTTKLLVRWMAEELLEARDAFEPTLDGESDAR